MIIQLIYTFSKGILRNNKRIKYILVYGAEPTFLGSSTKFESGTGKPGFYELISSLRHQLQSRLSSISLITVAEF